MRLTKELDIMGLPLFKRIKNFPINDVDFLDISPALDSLQSREFIVKSINNAKVHFKELKPTKVIGIDARGFLFLNSVADSLNASAVMARKSGKLPTESISKSYDLEYGSSTLSLAIDSIQEGDRVVIHDDVLATGGSAKCVKDLVEQLGGEVVGYLFLVDILFKKDLSWMGDAPCFSLFHSTDFN